jgi:hypothetical protein
MQDSLFPARLVIDSVIRENVCGIIELIAETEVQEGFQKARLFNRRGSANVNNN